MIDIIVRFAGDDDADEARIEQLEEQVQSALDAAGVDYLDIALG